MTWKDSNRTLKEIKAMMAEDGEVGEGIEGIGYRSAEVKERQQQLA
jgi:hypothetical protein